MNNDEARLRALERRFEELLRRVESIEAMIERERQEGMRVNRGS